MNICSMLIEKQKNNNNNGRYLLNMILNLPFGLTEQFVTVGFITLRLYCMGL